MKKKYFDLYGNRTHDLRIRSTVTLPSELRPATKSDRESGQKSSFKSAYSATWHNIHKYSNALGTDL